MKEEKKHDGDYKVEISDKGNINFTLNWKWVMGIASSLLTFIGYLLIKVYFISPMENLKTDVEEKNETINILKDNYSVLESNQKILLDRSERTEKIMMRWIEDNGGLDIDQQSVPTLPNRTPGSDSN
jgi:hypothetical protein